MAADEQIRSTPAAHWSLAPPAPGEPVVGQLIDGRYVVEGVLGEGAMGIVYRARERLLERPVALKAIAPVWAGDPLFIAGFLQEARAMARIRHPNVVRLYTVGEEENVYYLAMEFIAGASLDSILARHLERGEQLSLHNVVALLADIIDGTAAIHDAGLVHCDLKPSNVVVEDQTGRPVIIDFGLAAHAQRGGQASPAGSPAYLSPERAAGAPPSVQSDIYALGVTAYELLTGCLPYPARTGEAMLAMHRELPVPKMTELLEDRAPFEPFVERALSKDPEERFTSCEEMGAALQEARAGWGHQLGAPATTPCPDVDSNEIRIVIVDDDPHFRRAASRAAKLAFSDKEVRVLPASTGLQAVAIAGRRMPALMLLDYHLPELDGVATLSTIRSMPRGRDLRVAVISGAVEDVRWRFEALGVTDFLEKPIDLERLIETVQTHLGHGAGRLAQRST